MLMNNINFLKGVLLIAIAVTFGIASTSYSLGDISRAGPGLFPFFVSCALGLIGTFAIIRSRYIEPKPISHSFKNVTVILLAICLFAFVSSHVNSIAGIFALVFCSSLASSDYSVVRNLKISAALIAIAFVFSHFLDLNLPLIWMI